MCCIANAWMLDNTHFLFIATILNAHVNKRRFVGLYIVMTLTPLCLTMNFWGIGWNIGLQFYYGLSCCNCPDDITLLSFIGLIVICSCISIVQSIHTLLCFDLCFDLDLWWPWPKVTTYSKDVILQWLMFKEMLSSISDLLLPIWIWYQQSSRMTLTFE